MTQRHSEQIDAGALAFGLSQTSGVEIASLATELVVVPGQLAYMSISAADLRNFVDGMFPHLATNAIADSAKGYGHRYRAGHDLLFDVPATFQAEGSWQGLKHAGHIILTDFPTKAGIPIPGFSHTGLGHLLEQVGITNGWLQLSLFDTGVGLFAIADSASALVAAMHGALAMNVGTACQTFGVGSVEIRLAITTQNPILLAGGLQNLLAGIVSTWQTISVYVNPLDLFGAAATSALLGFGLAYGLARESPSDAARDAVRSGAVGALYAVSTAFGFGALAGFTASRLGGALAECHNAITAARMSVDKESYRLLVEALCAGNDQIGALLDRASPRVLFLESPPFRPQFVEDLAGDAKTLTTARKYLVTDPLMLGCDPPRIDNRGLILLSSDHTYLPEWFAQALSKRTNHTSL